MILVFWLKHGSISLRVVILSDGGLENGESGRTANSTADKSTILIHRTNEINEEFAKVYKKGVWLQTRVAR